MNYKKSILSLVTIMALSGTASADGAATYLPLTSDEFDASWTLFGVNGFSDGTASIRGSGAVGFSSGYTEIVEADTFDADATDGLSATGATGDDVSDYLMSIQAIDDSGLTALKVAAQVLHPHEKKEPVRSMYIKVNSNTPNVKIDYKSSMEGQPLELMVNDVLTLYSVTINQDNTYSNAALAVESSPVESTTTKLSTITDVLDYNFKNNPLDAKYFVKDTHLNTERDLDADSSSAKAKSATFYHFDAISEEWKIWDRKFTGSANDFTSFTKGDAYWGLIDTNNAVPDNDTGEDGVTQSGLILGSSGVSVPDSTVYETDGVTRLDEGWNMIALDPSQPYIRHASTGLIATMTDNNGDIEIWDSTGQFKVRVNLVGDDSLAAKAQQINVDIEKNKLIGLMPASVNIKAFASGTGNAGNIIFISDAKFTLTDIGTAGDNIGEVTTLTGANPYDASGVRDNVFTDLNSTAVDPNAGFTYATSAYGEFGFVVDLLTEDLASNGGATVATAATLDFNAAAAGGGDTVSAKIRFGTAERDYSAIALTSVADAKPTALTAKGMIEDHPLFSAATPADATGEMHAIDSDGNGANDKVIITSTVPFYIKDNTYTRVFTYDDAASVNDGVNEFTVVGTQSAPIKPISGSTAAQAAAQISAQADTGTGDTGVYADYNGSKLIAVSTTLSTFDLKDLENGNYGFLTVSSDKSDLAKGAIAGVYSLSAASALPVVQGSMTFTDFDLPYEDSAGDYVEDNITITFNGDSALEYNITDINITDEESVTDIKAYFDTIVTAINTNAQNPNNPKHIYAYHDYGSEGYSAADIAAVKITINGLDLDGNTTTITCDTNNSTPSEFSSPTVENNNSVEYVDNSITYPAAKTLGSSWTPLVSDLRTNATFTPDFASYGPLYTMFDAGYKIRSVLKATTAFTDQSIAWDGIDITRDEDDWFKNNEFNLFKTNQESGYWTYLVQNSDVNSSIVIDTSSASYIPTYTYYFDNKTGDDYPTTNIINGGQFKVKITGFSDDITNAFVTVAGEEIQLRKSGIANEYTADFMKYSLAGFSEGSSSNLSFSVRATDGKGEYVKVSDVLTFDYTASSVIAPTVVSKHEIKLNLAEGLVQTDLLGTPKYYVFNEYIPELESSRTSTDADVSRSIGSYDVFDINGTASAAINICQNLDFGEVNNLRYVVADGTGVIGTSNLSDAIQFSYAVMLKNSTVLYHDADSAKDKSIVGLQYGSTCEASAAGEDTNISNNAGVSLKTLSSGQYSRMAYQEIAGVSSSLSGAWVSTYSIENIAVIQIQNIQEYAGKPFFIQYGGKMYRSAFPSTIIESDNSSVTPIALDDSETFKLNSDGERVTTVVSGVSGGTGELLSSINNTLSPSE